MTTPAPRKKIGVVGSRKRYTPEDYNLVRAYLLDNYKPGDTIVSGGCPQGADRFAERIAYLLGYSILIHYPDWNGPYGSFAGIHRNTYIARDCHILVALPAADRTGGTEDTIRKAIDLGKKVILL